MSLYIQLSQIVGLQLSAGGGGAGGSADTGIDDISEMEEAEM